MGVRWVVAAGLGFQGKRSVMGLVRLAVMLQEAHQLGPTAAPRTTAAVLSPIPAQAAVQVQSAVPVQVAQWSLKSLRVC